MQRKEIERLLPGVFQSTLVEGGPLAALLAVMDDLHARPEAVLSSLETTFDPRRAPDAFVPFLARWVNLEVRVTTGLGRLRELVAVAVELSRWRGTAHGLLRFLETATGERGFRIDEGVPDATGRPRPFHIRVTAPPSVAAHRPMLEQIIEREKPAYVTYELMLAGPSRGVA